MVGFSDLRWSDSPISDRRILRSPIDVAAQYAASASLRLKTQRTSYRLDTMTKGVAMAFCTVIAGCGTPGGADPADAGGPRDTTDFAGVDGGRDDVPDAADVGVDESDESRCERGTWYDAELGLCNVLLGCNWFALVRDEHGCVFFPDTIGRLTQAECASDDDCTNSVHGPYCVTRVCHEYPPCTDDEDCAEGLVCINYAICMPPRSSCSDDDDCPEPAICLTDFDGMCG